MKTFTKGLVAGAVFALVAPAFAEEPAKGTTGMQGTPGMHEPMEKSTSAYPGVIKEVDQDKKMVTLQVPLAPNAAIMKDGQKVTLADVKEGDDVRASFDPQTHKIIKLDVQSKEMMDKGKPMEKKTKGMEPTTPPNP